MTTFPLIHLPPGGRNPNFTGRAEMLARLDAQLNGGQGTAVLQSALVIWATALGPEYPRTHIVRNNLARLSR